MEHEELGDDLTAEAAEDELEEEEARDQKPAVVINIHSWATPIVGLVMLLLGLFLGYAGRTVLPQGLPAIGRATTPTVAAQAPAAEQVPGNAEELMTFLISQTRHFKGDANAPVTLIEFSDFQ